jgi:hypothetical protein
MKLPKFKNPFTSKSRRIAELELKVAQMQKRTFTAALQNRLLMIGLRKELP